VGDAAVKFWNAAIKLLGMQPNIVGDAAIGKR